MWGLFEIGIFEIILALASFCAISGAIGIIRLPDIYTRVHANTIAAVGGTILLCLTLGIKFYPTSRIMATKLLFLSLILCLTAPTASYLAGKAAFLSRIKPWRKK